MEWSWDPGKNGDGVWRMRKIKAKKQLSLYSWFAACRVFLPYIHYKVSNLAKGCVAVCFSLGFQIDPPSLQPAWFVAKLRANHHRDNLLESPTLPSPKGRFWGDVDASRFRGCDEILIHYVMSMWLDTQPLPCVPIPMYDAYMLTAACASETWQLADDLHRQGWWSIDWSSDDSRPDL